MGKKINQDATKRPERVKQSEFDSVLKKLLNTPPAPRRTKTYQSQKRSRSG